MEVIKVIKGLAPRWVALGGGGYELKVVPRAWSLAYGIMLDLELPDEIPSDYQERYGLQRLRDREKPRLDAGTKERARWYAEREVEEVKRTIFPFHES